jgi:hypothetical protein
MDTIHLFIHIVYISIHILIHIDLHPLHVQLPIRLHVVFMTLMKMVSMATFQFLL